MAEAVSDIPVNDIVPRSQDADCHVILEIVRLWHTEYLVGICCCC